ncbi:helix-turn-helix domain-containing protein [Flavobacterium lacus]|uniref:Helix-turn-helix protein n=1 Tax=Flavobacterium lacus TaxID=1353778 RepID=A0A328WRX7_9FLAO|nr:helix-turn-helix transcriptional regulator [Flavobacterium lacus]RAR48961.1 helix-turn-helix protein [Flavobacterium lacus]
MQNTQDFVQKLEIILQYFNLSASAFADKIGVQRSSLSHLLSGRNKPSLEFVIKITAAFPEVDLYWFLFNKGSFPKSNSTETTAESEEIQLKNKETTKAEVNKPEKNLSQNQEDVEKIVVFYKNGSFKTYLPK